MPMAKYIVRYESRDYYEKEYEANSFDEAETLFYADDKLFEGTPYNSDMELIEIVDEEGLYE
jgi:hypothetical protein